MKTASDWNELKATAREAISRAIERGDAQKGDRFHIQLDTSDSGEPVYSLWRLLWGNESELMDVLEVKNDETHRSMAA